MQIMHHGSHSSKLRIQPALFCNHGRRKGNTIQMVNSPCALVGILAGGLGNLIDRIRLGYVVDMFEVEFMNFAVFNVADIFITCGAVVLFVYVLFFDRKEKKDAPAA